jgi:hypothetical protein
MIAVDDLGSGLPSFAYLEDLQVDFLKIDGMFVKDIDADTVALAIVRSKNEIGQVMGKQTIAPRLEHRSSKCQYELSRANRGWKCELRQIIAFDVTHITGGSVRTDVDFFQAVLLCRHYGTTAIRDSRAL